MYNHLQVYMTLEEVQFNDLLYINSTLDNMHGHTVK